MNINPDSQDSLLLNFNAGGNSPPANPIGYNGSPLAASQMDAEEVSSLVKLAEELVIAKKQQPLKPHQKELLHGILSGLKYKEIQADKKNGLQYYRVEHIGSYISYELRKLLTEILQDEGVLSPGEKVNKTNVREYLQRVVKKRSQLGTTAFSPEPEKSGKVTHTLPCSDKIYWVGREALIAELNQKLLKDCRVLSLVGITGIGKTALAGRLTIEPTISQAFPVLKIVNFDVELPDFNVVARRILGDEIATDEVFIQSPERLVAAIVAKLKTHSYLLVLDMVEAVLEIDKNGNHQFKESVFLQFLEQVVRTDAMSSRIVITSQYKLPVLAEGRYLKRTETVRLSGLEETEALELFECWDVNLQTDVEMLSESSLIKRLIRVYEGHPLALRVIAGEIRSAPYNGDIQAYWHDYGQEIEAVERMKYASKLSSREDKPRLDRYSIDLTDLVKTRIEKTFANLLKSAPLACLMLCMGAKYRRAVERKAWLILIDDYSDSDEVLLMAFQTLQRRFFLEEESTPHKVLYRLHSLVRRVALDNLPKIEDEVLLP